MGCRCPCLEADVVDEMSAARHVEYHKLFFCDVSKQKWHVSSCSAGGLSRPNSDMIVGDKTSSASARFPTCSMFSN